MSTSRLWPFVGIAALSGAAGFGTSAWLRPANESTMREELRTAAYAPTSPAPKPRSAERAPEPGAQSVAAFNQGRGLVENAVAVGRWSDTQRQELRALLSQLTQEQREEVMRTLVVSINSGKVKVELVGAPF